MNKERLEQAKQGAPAEGPDCSKCGHIAVCAVNKAIAPLMGNWPEDMKPFEPGKIAVICNFYAENFVIIGQKSEGSGA